VVKLVFTPSTATGTASNVSPFAATLQGVVSPQDSATSYHFD
jgi:hypothetical protein